MKKMILIFTILSVSAFAFARPIFQADLLSVGIHSIVEKNAFNEIDSWDGGTSIVPIPTEALGTFLWEFDSGTEQKNHYFIGLESGFFGIGVPITLVGGLNINLKEGAKRIHELSISLQPGIWIPALNSHGQPVPYIKGTVDFFTMRKNRRGFYYGPGISNTMLYEVSYYEYFGIDLTMECITALRFTFGYRL